MSWEARMRALVRGLTVVFEPDGSEEGRVQMTRRGELLTAGGLPPLAEISRLGNSWQAILATPVAPVTAIPTTAMLIGLYNGEPAGGKSYLVQKVLCLTVALTAAQQLATPLINLSTAAPAVPTGVITPKATRTGKGPYGGKALVPTGGTLAVSADGWFPVGTPGGSGAASTFGQNVDGLVDGLYIVTPGQMMNVSAISTAATASSILLGFVWHEIQLDLP